MKIVDNKSASHPKGPLSLVIGVTGHRDLRPEDISVLENRVSEVLSNIKKSYPGTPLLLLSPLAEGADRLVARVALRIGIQMAVPMPFTQEEYEKDFPDPDSKQEFRNLLAQTVWRCVVPSPNEADFKTQPQAQSARNLHYEQVGAFIVKYCQILLALWDGNESSKVGETAKIVNYKLKGIPNEIRHEKASDLEEPETGIVYQIVTPRSSSGQISNADTFAVKYLLPYGFANEKGKTYFHEIFQRIEIFNKNSIRIEQKVKSQSACPPEIIQDSDLQRRLGTSLRKIFALADYLAQRLKKRYKRVIFGLACVLVILVALFHLRGVAGNNTYLALYLAGWAIAWLCFAVAVYYEWEKKYLDYRALAEALRIQIFWKIAGLEENVARHYLIKYRSALDWIRIALRNAEILTTVPNSAVKGNNIDYLKIIKTKWIDEQAAWYDKKYAERQRTRKRLNTISMLFLLLSMLGACAYLFLHSWADSRGMMHFTFFIIKMLLAGAAAIQGYQRVLALREEAAEYLQMKIMFSRAAERILQYQNIGDYESAKKLMLEIGTEALSENADWVLTHSKRMEPPKA